MATEVTVTLRFEFDEYVPEPEELERTIEESMFDDDNPVVATVVDIEEV